VKRLVDERLREGSPEHWLAELVRAMPPSRARPFQERRIFARIGTATRPRGSFFVRTATIPLVLCAATFAVAAGRHVWLSHDLHLRLAAPSTPPTAAAPVASPASPPPLPPDRASPPTTPAADMAPASSPTPARTQGETASSLNSPGRADRAVASRPIEGPGLVLSAIHALRETDNPSQAGTLLSRYLSLYPRGVLAEDALALSIEAAAARHDGRAIVDFGRRYLAQYPNGRFRAMALGAVQRTRQ